jgi:hypothetical protein
LVIAFGKYNKRQCTEICALPLYIWGLITEMRNYQFCFALLFCFLCNTPTQAQTNSDSTKNLRYFGGNFTATNNGISLLPNFTLGRPAVLFDLNMGRKRLSFDPMFRFRMDGRPWAFIFWGRYKLIQKPKFTLSVGAHPSFVFRPITVFPDNGDPTSYLTTQRFFAWELAPTYHFNRKTNAGFYYLGARGLAKNQTQHTHFIGLRSALNRVQLSPKYYLNLSPQVYYLNIDRADGVYVSAQIALLRQNFPISISSILNYKIESDIPGAAFVWNLQLSYIFLRQYAMK